MNAVAGRLAYPTFKSDSCPTAADPRKAAAELVQLLNAAYNAWWLCDNPEDGAALARRDVDDVGDRTRNAGSTAMPVLKRTDERGSAPPGQLPTRSITVHPSSRRCRGMVGQ